ncbi:hypothetical protein C8R44DRAFT_203733 [Mycena epipterygia]|nr:hypothetical protein C8R44DRAFT_203733 [Mycena epipterygia]
MQLCRFRFSSFVLLLHYISLSDALPAAIAVTRQMDTTDFPEEPNPRAHMPYAPTSDSILPKESILVAGIVILALCSFGALISLLQFARSYCRTRRRELTVLYLNSPVYPDPARVQLFVDSEEAPYAAPPPPYCPPPPSYQDKRGPQKAGWLPADRLAREAVSTRPAPPASSFSGE